MNEFTYGIVRIVIAVAIAIITRYVVPFFKKQLQAEENAEIAEIISVAVQAAEQTIRDPKSGSLKKGQVVDFVTNWLNEHKIMISSEQLDNLIEAAVYSLNSGKGQ